MAADGLITIPSSYGAKDTADRLDAAINARGMTVFARIDHAAGAAEVGLALQPTELLIFGNARGGTPLMQSNQMIGIDLPLKALVWQAMAKTWLSYNDPNWLAKRHGVQSWMHGVANLFPHSTSKSGQLSSDRARWSLKSSSATTAMLSTAWAAGGAPASIQSPYGSHMTN